METNWIETEVAKGLQGLLCLSLDRQPALELIEGTLGMWVKVITNGRVFDEAKDAKRFRAAFLTLAARKTWPVPMDFIESLPSNVMPFEKPLRLDNENVRKARMQAFADVQALLNIPEPKSENGDAA